MTSMRSPRSQPAATSRPGPATPEYRRLAEMVDGRAPALRPLNYESELQALIQWMPLDISMPALAHDAIQLRTHLQRADVQIASDGERLRLLAYKPGRRAVLRLDDHVIKIYAGDVEFAGAVTGLEASSRLEGLRIPRREAVLPELHLTCQAMLPGRPPSAASDPAQAAGAVLAALHRARLPALRSFTHADQLRAAAGSAGSVTAVVPELEQRLTGLLRTLELTIPDQSSLLPAHGDYHSNQLLEIDGGLAVIDFDEMCAAAAALDLASYAAHHVNGGEGDMTAALGGARRPRRGLWRPSSCARLVPLHLDPPTRAVPVSLHGAQLAAAHRAHGHRCRGGAAPVSVTRPPVPLDDALPAMPRMLDVDAMAPVLERSLGGTHSIDSVTIRYLRYKQGRSLLVRYEVGSPVRRTGSWLWRNPKRSWRREPSGRPTSSSPPRPRTALPRARRSPTKTIPASSCSGRRSTWRCRRWPSRLSDYGRSSRAPACRLACRASFHSSCISSRTAAPSCATATIS